VLPLRPLRLIRLIADLMAHWYQYWCNHAHVQSAPGARRGHQRLSGSGSLVASRGNWLFRLYSCDITPLPTPATSHPHNTYPATRCHYSIPTARNGSGRAISTQARRQVRLQAAPTGNRLIMPGCRKASHRMALRYAVTCLVSRREPLHTGDRKQRRSAAPFVHAWPHSWTVAPAPARHRRHATAVRRLTLRFR
jgi:hypothetical protein